MLKEKKQLSFFMASLPIFSMILFLGIGYISYDLRAEPMLLLAALTAALIAYYHGYTFDEILFSVVSKLQKSMPAILILISVGILIGAWMIGGTIPMLIYYGLQKLDPTYFYVSAFLLTSITSLTTGTSWGAAGTIGVALMGVAQGFSLSLPIAAGAIISGAYFGDKLSPLSDSTNLASIAANTPLYAHISHMLWTTGPTFIICLIIYSVIGFSQNINHIEMPDRIIELSKALSKIYKFNIFIIIPPLIVLYGSFTKKPTIPILFISSAFALLNAIFIQKFSVNHAVDSIIYGFKLSMIENQDLVLNLDVSRLLERGGMISMMSTLVICFCAFAFAGAMAVTNSLDIVIHSLINRIKSVFVLITTTLFSTILICAITSNGALSVLLPGEMFQNIYKKFGLAPQNLSRSAEDAGTVIEPILPWTAAGVYMASMLDVATLEYLPYAFLNYIGLIFAIIWAATGIGIAKLVLIDEEY